MGRARSHCGGRGLGEPVPPRNGLEALMPTARRSPLVPVGFLSRESKSEAGAQGKFQELIKALSGEETLSPTEWKDQWSRTQLRLRLRLFYSAGC